MNQVIMQAVWLEKHDSSMFSSEDVYKPLSSQMKGVLQGEILIPPLVGNQV